MSVCVECKRANKSNSQHIDERNERKNDKFFPFNLIRSRFLCSTVSAFFMEANFILHLSFYRIANFCQTLLLCVKAKAYNNNNKIMKNVQRTAAAAATSTGSERKI